MAPATRDIGEDDVRQVGVACVENEPCEAEIVNPVTPAGGSGRFLTRRQVARRLGLSLSTVRRMEGVQLKPIVGERGVRYFEETEIQAVFVRRRRAWRRSDRPLAWRGFWRRAARFPAAASSARTAVQSFRA